MIDVDRPSDIEKHAEAFVQRVEEEKDRALREAQALAKRRVPVDKGDLRDDVSIDLEEDTIYNTLDYAPHVNYGTEGPYVIEADEAEALRFEVDGETVFAESVIHPGIGATYYLTDSAKDAFRNSVERLRSA